MTGIGEDAVNSLFDLYPNPNGGSFTIDMRIPGVESWKLKIFNILGSEIWSENLGVVNGNMLKSIDLRQEDSGVYYIQLYNDHVTLRRKVVIY
ncbi:MAG TPA: T9SS type A sorting domain-containing protein [Flavobacteriales bacterium]|nr:T9SS type A sorting domain-containing protein [Flavobacteriales bacterium]